MNRQDELRIILCRARGFYNQDVGFSQCLLCCWKDECEEACDELQKIILAKDSEIARLTESDAHREMELFSAKKEIAKLSNSAQFRRCEEQQKEIASLQADLMSFDPATYPEAVKILQARDVEQQKRIEELEAEVVGCKKICKISAESEFRLLTDRDRYKKALEEIKNIGTCFTCGADEIAKKALAV